MSKKRQKPVEEKKSTAEYYKLHKKPWRIL